MMGHSSCCMLRLLRLNLFNDIKLARAIGYPMTRKIDLPHMCLYFTTKTCNKYELEVDDKQVPPSSDTESNEIVKKEKLENSTRLSTRKITSQEINKFLTSKPHMVQYLTTLNVKVLRKVNNAPESLYILDKDIAKQMVYAIGREVTCNKRNLFVEINPGPCVLSKALLEGGVSKLHLANSSRTHRLAQKRLVDQYPGKAQIVPTEFLVFARTHHQDKMDNGDRILRELQQSFGNSQKNKDKPIKLIGTIPQTSLLRYIVTSFINQSGMMTYTNLEFYFILHPKSFTSIACDPEAGYLHYRAMTVLFQILFDIKLLSKLPRKAFFPWETLTVAKKRSKTVTKDLITDADYLYFVKITPKPFSEIVPQNQLINLWFFVRHHLVSRKKAIVPQLEMWIPSCGPRLIIKGHSIYGSFGDCKPLEILDIFRNFISWPEFASCPFSAAAERAMSKQETGTSDVQFQETAKEGANQEEKAKSEQTEKK